MTRGMASKPALCICIILLVTIVRLSNQNYPLAAISNNDQTLYSFATATRKNINDNTYSPIGSSGNSDLECPRHHRSNSSISFIPPEQLNKDIYSGMWWQSINATLETAYANSKRREDVTFLSFGNAKRNGHRVLSTVDWLDLNVEHLSKYVKHFNGWSSDVGELMQQRVAEILERYIAKSKETCHRQERFGSSSSADATTAVHTAASSTIALLPLYIGSDTHTYANKLTVLQLTATVASLWNVGVPRAVVVGASNNEREAVTQMKRLLQEHLKEWPMEVEYVQLDETLYVKPTTGILNVPVEAMVQFQRALRQSTSMHLPGDGAPTNRTAAAINEDTVVSWLGAKHHPPSRWKHVYFSEPDLILHVRPDVLPLLSDALHEGHLLAAHRLNPLPHMRQFHDIYGTLRKNNATASPVVEGAVAAADSARSKTGKARSKSKKNAASFSVPKDAVDKERSRMEGKLLPDQARFAAFHSLDPLRSGDACCDQGKFFPPNRDQPDRGIKARRQGGCFSTWETCGFANHGNHADWAGVLEQHAMLVMVPFVALERGGTGLPLVHAGQRACTPKRGPGASCP